VVGLEKETQKTIYRPNRKKKNECYEEPKWAAKLGIIILALALIGLASVLFLIVKLLF